MNNFDEEIVKGERFEFGKNWRSFLLSLTEERIRIAEDSLKEMLGREDLKDLRFLDAGSGSGLFSLCARRLGAVVHSFDYDPNSVACAQTLRARYFSDDPEWNVGRGSVLDESYLSSLGEFDVVYSWGVLHHTGSMWEAMERIAGRVKAGGLLFIALYNDQGGRSRFWRRVKQIYCSSLLGRMLICSIFIPYFFWKALLASLKQRENAFAQYKRSRGMSITHDWLDWLGGYPFEVAKVENVFHFYKKRGFELANIKTTNGLGNNEFVFLRTN